MSDDTPRRTKVYSTAKRYLKATLSADVDLLDTMPVAFSFDLTEWHTGEFIGDVAQVRRARLLLDAEADPPSMPAPGTWPVYVRLSDDPEADIDQAGILEVI